MSELEELRVENKQLRETLEQLREGASEIAVIESGPHQGKYSKNHYYRITSPMGGRVVVDVREDVNNAIRIQDEVLLVNGGIVDIVPENLRIKKNKDPFQHIGWDSVGGLKSQIEDIKRQVESPIRMRTVYRDFGISPSKGMLLWGPPGNGKTLIARVIASMIIDKDKGDAKAFVYVKGPELLHGLVGSTEQHIRTIFHDCRTYTKDTGSGTVVFIDEAEALLRTRGKGISSDVNMTVVPQFLSEMDGFDEYSPFILLATNAPELIDPAVIREGRVDLKVEIKRPDQEDAEEIFAIHLKKVKCFDTVAVLSKHGSRVLFHETKQTSGSTIATIVNLAAIEALYRFTSNRSSSKGVIKEDISSAVKKVIESQIH